MLLSEAEENENVPEREDRLERNEKKRTKLSVSHTDHTFRYTQTCNRHSPKLTNSHTHIHTHTFQSHMHTSHPRVLEVMTPHPDNGMLLLVAGHASLPR